MGVNELPDPVLVLLAVRGVSCGMAITWSDLWDLTGRTSRLLTLQDLYVKSSQWPGLSHLLKAKPSDAVLPPSLS